MNIPFARVLVLLPPDQLRRMKEIKAETGSAISEQIRQAIAERLKRHEKVA